MGFNIAGILTNRQLDKKEDVENTLQRLLQYDQQISGEEATLTKDSDEFDVYSNDRGSILLLEMGEIHDLSHTEGEFIEFMISDVSDSYYFKKYRDGIVERELIMSQGEVLIDEGSGFIDKDDDFMDKILDFATEMIGMEDIFSIDYKRYKPSEKSPHKAQVGDEGNVTSFSYATRAMNMDPDKDQIKKFDELAKGTNKIKLILSLGSIILAAALVYLFVSGHWIIGGILTIIELIIIVLASLISNTNAYKNGLIIPAIVVETNPIKIIALADMRDDEGHEIIWGCRKVTLKTLPNHKIEIGEKVPCISLFSMAVDGYRKHFEPRPISWGFKDPSLISKVVDLITNDGLDDGSDYSNEWELLEKLAEKMKDTTKEDEVLFYDQDLTQIEMGK